MYITLGVNLQPWICCARLKAVGGQLCQWTKKIRQSGGTWAIGSGEDFEDSSDEEDNLAVGPVHQMISNITKIQIGITRPATPKTPDIRQSPITPDIKQSPPSSKKAKFFFKTGSKGKLLWRKTPLKKSSVKKSTPPFKTPEAVLKGTEKGILKKLEPAPGWKPFETPAKWKVDGQDW